MQEQGNFVVSARKYRPSTFSSVVGQKHITDTLRNALRQNRMAHSFLFCGPRGVGKTTCARILAKAINCTALTKEYEPCNACESCTSFNRGASMNIFELDAASNNSVEDIRSLTDQVRYAPQGGRYKTYIIDEVHMLSAAAFNAFLKTLEEPPSYAVFILATTEKSRIIPTILSRCQIFDFSRIQVKDCTAHLADICKQEGVQAEPGALHVIALKADGALRDALSIFDRMVSLCGNTLTYKDVIRALSILDYDYYFKVTDALLAGDTPAALTLLDAILRDGFEGDDFIGGLSEHFRNLLVCKEPRTIGLLEVTEDLQERYLKQAAASGADFLLNSLDIAGRCDTDYRNSRNKRLLVELALIKMTGPSAGAGREETGSAKAQEPKKKAPDNKVTPPVKTPPGEQGKNGLQAAVTPAKTPDSGPRIAGSLPSFRTTRPKASNGAAAAEPAIAEPAAPGSPPDESSFSAAWTLYLEHLKKSGKDYLWNLLRSVKPLFIPPGAFEVAVRHGLEESQLAEEKMNLVAFLRKELRAGDLEMRIILRQVEPGENRQIYTNKEKFNHMAGKNPHITQLKEALDLDIEF